MKRIEVGTALAYIGAGLCALPAVRAKKLPPLRWKRYQTEFPDEATVREWFATPRDAVCVLTGAISGGLECIDFDHKAAFYPAWREAVVAEIGADVFERLPVERTQSGGRHVYLRCPEACEGNQPLAYGPSDEEGVARPVVYIETRGEGGLVLCAPTEGYDLEQGDLAAVPELTPIQRAAMLDAARALDVRRKAAEPARAVRAPAAPAVPSAGGSGTVFELRPGDDFNARAPENGAFRKLLEDFGWTFVGTDRGNERWKRPGKEGEGPSATFNGVCFYVFSSNALPFEQRKGYSPFEVYTILAHGGDHTAAARALLADGWGRATEEDLAPLRVIPSGASAPAPIALPSAAGEAAPEDEPKRKPPRKAPSVDPRLYSIPGFVDALAAYTLRKAHYPNLPLAFAGALAFLSLVAGRRYRTRSGTYPNLYILSIGPTGIGKNAPQETNEEMARRLGLLDCLGDKFSSGPGLIDALRRCPVKLYQKDELTQQFRTLSATGDALVLSNGLTEAMLTIYSRAGGTLRRGDVSAVSRRGDSLPNDVPCPSLTILGSATPEQFYETLTPDMIGEGLIGRFIAIEAARLESYNIPDKEETPPASVLAHAKKLLARGKNVHADDFDPDRDFVRVEMDGDGARQAQQALFEDNFERRRKLSQKGDADSRTENALCAREVEKIEKLALLYALSENAEEPRITVAGYSWASAFVRAHNRLLFERVRDNTGGTDESRLAQHILAFLRERGGSVPKADITRRLRHSKNGKMKNINDALGSLVESGEITRTVLPTTGPGRPPELYALAEVGEE